MGKIVKFKKIKGSCINIGNRIYEFHQKNYVVKRIPLQSIDESKLNQSIDSLREEGFQYILDWNTNLSLNLSYENIKSQPSDEYINFFVVQKYFSKKEIVEVFDFKINIQVASKQIQTFYSMVKEDRKTINHEYITFVAENDDNFCGEEHHKKVTEMDRLFGQRYKSNNWHQSDQWRSPDEYRIHVSKIEKIFLIKFYKDVELIGTEREHEFNGRQETLELNMRNPDFEIYKKMSTIDNCIEIDWE